MDMPAILRDSGSKQLLKDSRPIWRNMHCQAWSESCLVYSMFARTVVEICIN